MGLPLTPRTQGVRSQRGINQPAKAPVNLTAREARQGWAALIMKVYESDPLCCPNCGATMKIIGFIQRHQIEVIEKILRHCGLWEEAPARDPPPVPEPAVE